MTNKMRMGFVEVIIIKSPFSKLIVTHIFDWTPGALFLALTLCAMPFFHSFPFNYFRDDSEAERVKNSRLSELCFSS